jgi:heptosyltransferase-2
LAAEPCIAETIYFEHAGSELRRGLNVIRLVTLLRRRHFRTLWILDRTTRPALAGLFAGIPQRIGLGLGAQKLFITNAGIAQRHFHDQPVDRLRALLKAMNVPLPTTEPALSLPDETLAAITEKFKRHARPWLALGIGASHPEKDWPDAYWTEFLDKLRRLGTVFLLGGAATMARAQNLIARGAATTTVNACDLTLTEAAALLQLTDLFVGTDSGPMNLAAAGATDAFALFGATPVLTYSKFIHAIAPPGGPAAGGMLRILPADVLERIAPYLGSEKARL